MLVATVRQLGLFSERKGQKIMQLYIMHMDQ